MTDPLTKSSAIFAVTVETVLDWQAKTVYSIDTNINIYSIDSFKGNRVVADNLRTHGAEPERSTHCYR